MSISVKCPNGHKLVLKDEHAGKKVRCPKCKVIMRAPRERWEVAPTLSEATSVERPVLMCAAGHRFLVLSDHESDNVRCPLCDQPAGVPVSATILTANGRTIVAETPGATAPMAVAAFSGAQASVLADNGATTLPTVAPIDGPDRSLTAEEATTSAVMAEAAPVVETSPQQLLPPPTTETAVAASATSPVVSENPYESQVTVSPAEEVAVDEQTSSEKLWPLFLLVGGAAATLVGIAFWVKQSTGE